MRKYVLIDGVDVARMLDAVVATASVGTPQPKRYTVDIPYGNGCIDLSLVNGRAVFQNREITLEFVGAAYEHPIAEVRSWLGRNVNGREVELRFSDEIDWAYKGFATVTDVGWEATNVWKATVEVDAEPYKTLPATRLRVDAIGGTTVSIWGHSMPVQPVFTFKAETVVSDGANAWVMQPGTYTLEGLWLESGSNRLYFNVNVGDGDVLISSFGEETIADHASQRIAELTWVSEPTEYMTVEELGGYTEKELESKRIYDLRKEMTVNPDDYYITIEYERGEL